MTGGWSIFLNTNALKVRLSENDRISVGAALRNPNRSIAREFHRASLISAVAGGGGQCQLTPGEICERTQPNERTDKHRNSPPVATLPLDPYKEGAVAERVGDRSKSFGSVNVNCEARRLKREVTKPFDNARRKPVASIAELHIHS